MIKKAKEKKFVNTQIHSKKIKNILAIKQIPKLSSSVVDKLDIWGNTINDDQPKTEDAARTVNNQAFI